MPTNRDVGTEKMALTTSETNNMFDSFESQPPDK